MDDAELAPGAEPDRPHQLAALPAAVLPAPARRSSRSSVLVILIVACFGAPWLAPYKQNAQNLLDERPGPEPQALVRHRRPRPRPAQRDHVRGADLARDRPGRSRCSRPSSGVTVGAVAAYFGGGPTRCLSAVTDLFLDPARPRVARGRGAALRPRRHVDHPGARRDSAGRTSRGSCARRCCR